MILMKHTFSFTLIRICASACIFILFLTAIASPMPISLSLAIVAAIIAALLFLTRNLQIRPGYVDHMSGEKFERYCRAWFHHRGYFAIRTTQKTKDYGADLIMRKGLHKIVVQAKRYDRNIGVYAIQQAMAAKAYYNADKAIVITNQYFTYSARKLAEVNDVQLIDRSDLFHIPGSKKD